MRRNKVTKQQLESYRSMKEEIIELKYKLEHLGQYDQENFPAIIPYNTY
jgi:hypothetical protein